MRIHINIDFREFWNNYRSEVFFFLILLSFSALSHWLSRFIPEAVFTDFLTPIQSSFTMAICLISAWVMFRHSDGLRFRRMWGWTMLVWGLAEGLFLCQTYFQHSSVLLPGTNAATTYGWIAGNCLGWLLLLYPTETLRPGWMNWKIAIIQLLPMVALGILDYLLPYDLRWLLALYPALLTLIAVTHIRAYRIWCETNYSSMEHIDAQWIVRYLVMLICVGLSYMYVMVPDNPARLLTQNMLLQFMFIYSTDQILFRKDPWEDVSHTAEGGPTAKRSYSDNGLTAEGGQPDNVRLLEQWMQTEKPYLNPDFQLMDLQAVLMMNRTYLSEFIKTTYGCTFYQLVNTYRVEEAKRLMQENPRMKLAEVRTRSGFSSSVMFSRVFTRVTGLTPTEWSAQLTASV